MLNTKNEQTTMNKTGPNNRKQKPGTGNRNKTYLRIKAEGNRNKQHMYN